MQEKVKCPLCGKDYEGKERISIKLGFKKNHTNRFMRETFERMGIEFKYEKDIFYFHLTPDQYLKLVRKEFWFLEVFIFKKPDIIRFLYDKCDCLRPSWPTYPSKKEWVY